MSIASALYKKYKLRRVYYSGYVPISNDNRLPQLGTPVPIIRENRLYQADWLMRFYGFAVNELVDPSYPQLDLDIDPKLSWALRNLHQFPVDINKAEYEMILRIPGIGVGSAQKIVQARRFRKLGWNELRLMGIAFNRAKHFVVCKSTEYIPRDVNETVLRQQILQQSKYASTLSPQLSMFA
jgi:predicted DNA-binding helix-hairpin-helix protein